MNAIRPRACNLTGGTPMTEALTLAQCAEMRTFLRALMHYGTGKKIKRKGITWFINEYAQVTNGNTRYRRLAK